MYKGYEGGSKIRLGKGEVSVMGDKRHGERSGAAESNWIFFRQEQ